MIVCKGFMIKSIDRNLAVANSWNARGLQIYSLVFGSVKPITTSKNDRFDISFTKLHKKLKITRN